MDWVEEGDFKSSDVTFVSLWTSLDHVLSFISHFQYENIKIHF